MKKKMPKGWKMLHEVLAKIMADRIEYYMMRGIDGAFPSPSIKGKVNYANYN